MKSLIWRFTKLKHLRWIFRLLMAMVIIGVVFGISWYKNKSICDKCNVILVSLDTLSALHLPCYGYERNTAPNLCAYADKNIFFANSYSQSPTTLDSHFSIFTSLYPHTHKMTDVTGDKLNEKYLTLAQLFRLNGYQTIYNGPFKDEHMPLNRGIERGFNIIEGEKIDTWNKAYSKLLENAKQNKPTFLFLHTYAVHDPYLAGHKAKHLFTDIPEYPNIPLTQNEYSEFSPEFLSFTADLILNKSSSFPVGYSKILRAENQIAKNLKNANNQQEAISIFNSLPSTLQSLSFRLWHLNQIDTTDPKQIEYLKAMYDEQIFNLDKKLGELFKLIEDQKLSKNTILIITADHGEEFMEHGKLYHGGNLYRPQTQVPLIMHIPGANPKKIKEMVQGIDIYPTALSLTGLAPKSPIEGIDLSGLIFGEKNAKTNKYLLNEVSGKSGIQYQNFRFYYKDKNITSKELYNLTTDPNEKKNIIYSNPGKANEILKLIQ